MGRLLAIDYGEKRVGIAVSDPDKLIATGLETVSTPLIWDFLTDYLVKESVETFVVGKAKQMDNTPSESSQYIEPFVAELAKRFPDQRIERVDERFTSKIASQSIAFSVKKKSKRRNKGLIDCVSAILILQTFMSQN
jgi:RNAse H-fold protein YqgF